MNNVEKNTIVLVLVLFLTLTLSANEFVGKEYHYADDRSSIIIHDKYTEFYWDTFTEADIKVKKQISQIIEDGYFKILETVEKKNLLFTVVATI
ncbi:hypothetical protein K7I13_11530 [Brucepastera parasyntrophica]|uniref:hypothetical protein n=1 Tax=Brucepastera parasyntrophica TaxID=2880008 RepID=UPI002108D505|nr:hypothetical protein [Brucepastera parasyntrophica]ULQ59127.1 hypothetical protein K7I13_11530 [Brucepastera parasyntrophica]